MLFTTTPGQHLGVVMNLNLILKIADMERDRPYEYSAFALNNVRAYSIYKMGCIILATTNHQ